MSNLQWRNSSPHVNSFHFTPVLTSRPLDPAIEESSDGDSSEDTEVENTSQCLNPSFSPSLHSKPHHYNAEEQLSPLSMPAGPNIIRITPPTPVKQPLRLQDSAAESSLLGASIREANEHAAGMRLPDHANTVLGMPSHSDLSMMASGSACGTQDHRSNSYMEESNVRNESGHANSLAIPTFPMMERPFDPLWGSPNNQMSYMQKPSNVAPPSSTMLAFAGSLGSNGRNPMPNTFPTTFVKGKRMRWIETDDITLRSVNGNFGADIPYPRNPSIEDLMYSLKDPNAPPSMAKKSAATTHHLQFYGYGIGGQVPRQHLAASFTAPGAPRMPGALPYRPPSAESYMFEDKNLRPRRQDEKLRFPGDLYTPRWIRGEHSAREGWCSLCHDGHWMQLKTSSYWYHVRFTHGVNSNTGRIYDPPQRLRLSEDSFASIFGLCGECNQWVTICTPRRKRSFCSWFKHAHKCHRVQCLIPMSMNNLLSSYHPNNLYVQPQLTQKQPLRSGTDDYDDATTDSPMSTSMSLMSSPGASYSILRSPTMKAASVLGKRTSYERTAGGNDAGGSGGQLFHNPTYAALQRYSWPSGTPDFGPPHNTPSASMDVDARTAPDAPIDDGGLLFNTLTGSLPTHRRSQSDGVLLG